MKLIGRRCWVVLGAASLSMAATGVAAQGDYPVHPVRLVVPYPPGGSTDNIARLYAEALGKSLKQPVIVDNRPGASTNIGSEMVAKATPDGYTLLFGGSVLQLNTVFGPKPTFDPQTALRSVSTVAQVPFMVAANPKLRVNKPKAFVDAAKGGAGTIAVSSAQLDVYVEQLNIAAQSELQHIPYKGGAQATTDAMGGQVQAVFALVPVLLPQVKAGKLKAIGVTSDKRVVTTLPNVPTFVEDGVNYTATVWYGVQAPAGLDAERLGRLNEATRRIVESGEFVTKLDAMGARAVASTPAEMDQVLSQLRQTWQQMSAANPKLVKSE